jgi:trafficking protein particle complex subunit 3
MKKQGEGLFTKMEKINSELLSVTYGTFVMQLLKDYKSIEEVNNKLESMYSCFLLFMMDKIRGFNIGIRMIDEFFAKSQQGPCSSFEETADVLAKVFLLK